MIIFIITFGGSDAFAEPATQGNPENLAVTLVIDTSGSMAVTDPQKLRETAANIFIDLLSPEDYLGIITFNSNEEVILPVQKVQGSENKSKVKKILSTKLETTSGDTDYLLALNQARKELDSLKNGNVRKVIVFLTDGEPDPNPSQKTNTSYMNQYMDTLWSTVSNLALQRYSVYSVGFSTAVDPAILERISGSTQGKVKISENSEELALSFFDVLGDLKNRQGFLDQHIEIQGKESLEFDLDEYTSQATMAFTNPSGMPYEVKITPPQGKLKENLIHINKSDKYTIVTINKEDEKLIGKWKVNLTGSGSFEAFGNKDSFIKSWLIGPESGSLHPSNEPIEISVQVTGEAQKGVSVEAILSKEGVMDRTPVKLSYKNGVYSGTYDNTDKTGKYDIETRLLQNGKVISTNQTSITVRALPSIIVDYWQKDAKYRIGEESTITSSLNSAGHKIAKSNEIQIENYNLLMNYSNSGTETIPLTDDGSAENRDIQGNDGTWTQKVNYKKQDSGEAFIIVNGTYKGEKFLLEKSLGNFTVYEPGEISITHNDQKIYRTSNNQLKIPVEIDNTSNFSETINFSIDKKMGIVQQSEITIKPLTKGNVELQVKLNDSIEKKNYVLPVKIDLDRTLVNGAPNEFHIKVQVLTKISHLMRSIKDHSYLSFIVLGSVIMVPLFIILLGLILYKLLVYKNSIILGKLLYHKEDSDLQDKEVFEFNKFNKGKIIISFKENNKSAQYTIPNSGYQYDMELYIDVKKGKFKFMDGWKALLHKSSIVEIILRTNEPGIFIYEGKVYTKKKIYNKDKFISGGYLFEYCTVESDTLTGKHKGKNILEGIT